MTPKISLVAVCCSNDSFSSWNSRTFSMAMTAWSAKVSSSSICRSVKASTILRQIEIVPIGLPSFNKGMASMVRAPDLARLSYLDQTPRSIQDLYTSSLYNGATRSSLQRRTCRPRQKILDLFSTLIVVSNYPQEFAIELTDMSLLRPDQLHCALRTASSTGWISVGEPAITRSISLVAVCCSSASRSCELELSSSSVLFLSFSKRLMFSRATPI